MQRNKQALTASIHDCAATVPEPMCEDTPWKPGDLPKVSELLCERSLGYRQFMVRSDFTTLRFHAAEHIVVGHLSFQGERQLLAPARDEETTEIFHRSEIRSSKRLVSEEHAQEERVRAEHQRGIVDNLRDHKCIPTSVLAAVSSWLRLAQERVHTLALPPSISWRIYT